MAETVPVDTPPVETHSVDTTDESSIVDDVIFGGQEGSVSEVFDEPEAPLEPEMAATNVVEESEQQETPSEQPPADNDEVRYQYWQSQADKLKNERDALQHQFNQLAVNSQPQQQQEAREAEPEVEFPDPPEKPQRPYNFNMDEAISDPQSESARFVREEQSWRDEMDDYKNLQFEYQMAMLEDEREQMRTQRQQDIQRREAEQHEVAQMQNIKQQVMNQYKVDSSVAEDFVRVMSDPSSISMDNLWKLYSSDKGYGSPQEQAAPSEEFKQVQRAQQVPPSMGVMPSQSRQSEGNVEDKIIDSMISDYNKQNPWN
tara:strand:+ start:142 stop:1086 length:945 start_codon:yes stop_codon:yes gene_type:complete